MTTGKEIKKDPMGTQGEKEKIDKLCFSSQRGWEKTVLQRKTMLQRAKRWGKMAKKERN